MSTSDTTSAVSSESTWPQRLRFYLAIALVWAALQWLAGAIGLTSGLDRPAVVLAADSGMVAVLLMAAALWIGAALASLLAGPRDGAQAPLIVGVALTIVAATGGTMDDWLVRQNTTPGPPTAAPYIPLLGEYLLVTMLMLGVILLGALAEIGGDAFDPAKRRAAVSKAFGLETTRRNRRDGLLALLTTSAVAAVLITLLMGPRAAHTAQGQVIFAVVGGFAIAVTIARRITGVRESIWYWPAPLVVGVGGLLLAIVKPALPGGYDGLDMIPSWALARPLPIQMIATGLAAIILTLRSAARLSHEEEPS